MFDKVYVADNPGKYKMDCTLQWGMNTTNKTAFPELQWTEEGSSNKALIFSKE